MGWLPSCGMEAGTPEARRAARRLIWWALGLSILSAAATIAAAVVLREEPGWPGWVRGAIALGPMLPFGAMFAVFVRAGRYLDEFAVRIQFEALATTVIASILMLVGWGQLQKASLMELTEVSAAWPPMVVIYAASYWLAQRRYR